MKLVGLSGYAQSGKDTVGQYLVENHGFTRVSFADKLREVALAIDPFVQMEVGMGAWHRLSSVVAERGWEEAKSGSTDVRRLLQRLGTEAGRNILGENLWVDAAMRQVDTIIPGVLKSEGNFVLTDVRFPNEFAAIKDRGGTVWRLYRPGYEPVNAHPSETALDDFEFDLHLPNTGTVEYLERWVRQALNASEGSNGQDKDVHQASSPSSTSS